LALEVAEDMLPSSEAKMDPIASSMEEHCNLEDKSSAITSDKNYGSEQELENK